MVSWPGGGVVVTVAAYGLPKETKVRALSQTQKMNKGKTLDRKIDDKETNNRTGTNGPESEGDKERGIDGMLTEKL